MKSLGALFRWQSWCFDIPTKPKYFDKNRKWVSDTFTKLSAEAESTINSVGPCLIKKKVKNAPTTGLFEIDHETYE